MQQPPREGRAGSIPAVGNCAVARHDATGFARVLAWPAAQKQTDEEEDVAEAILSSTESALENQRIGGLQLRVAGLCTLIQICDGYDINSIAWSVPSLTHVWDLKGSAFTVAFLWSSIGILVGALSAGPIGDRIGRKPLLLGSLTMFVRFL